MSESRRHSSACIDATECDGVGHCICLPDEEAPAPGTYELWWCSYCGEPSCEDSDPCQRCGESIQRVPLVAATERDALEQRCDRLTAALDGAWSFIETVTAWKGHPDDRHEACEAIREALKEEGDHAE
jgi:hypothetical protein